MSDQKNLWPEDLLSTFDLVLPVTILQNQAKFLNNMTKNVITAIVDTQKIALQSSKSGILHTLKISAPAIGNYDFDLVRVVQEELLPYPLKIYAPLTEEKFEASNSEEFEVTLGIIFNDKKTIATLQSLIVQSK